MTEENSSEMRADFLKAMRTVANSVTVVTTDGPGGKQGATVSSFCSVSADPPTLLVCLNANSRIFNAVSANRIFCVNVLPENLSDVAQRFAGFHDTLIEDRFEGIETEKGIEGPAVLSKATSFICQLDHQVQSGTHGIFIGHVTGMKRGKEKPLIYLDGAYCNIART